MTAANPLDPLMIPTRTTPALPIVNATAFTAATVSWQIDPPRDSLTVLVKGTFDIVPDARARARAESDPPTGDVHALGDLERSLEYASDFAFYKPRADVTVTGHAYPQGGPAPACRVGLRFGSGARRIERTLHVFGDRRWTSSVGLRLWPTEPAPFERMPLVYERAFGGPRCGDNPAGVGHRSVKTGEGPVRLPNLEDPEHPIVDPGDAPPPACFAPIAPMWPARSVRLGTYDERWQRTRWPYFPEDFDWTFFQSAPAAQQTDHLDGEEPFELIGMHPELPIVRGRLPGTRVQCFVQRTAEAGGGFEEIALRLDTAAFDVDGMKLNLVWRGLVEVRDEEASEIATLFVIASDLADPAVGLEEARAKLRIALAPIEPAPLPASEEDPANDVAEGPPEEDPELARIEAEMAAREAELAAELRAAGIATDHDAALEAPPPNPAAFLDQLRASGMAEEDVEELRGVLAPAPDEAPAREPLELAVRARVIAMLLDGEALDGMDLAGADLSDLDFEGRSLAGAVLRDAKLRRSCLRGAALDGAQMSGVDLTDADLTEARLSGADLTGATLSRARLSGADLGDADLSRVIGEGADFQRARGERARFEAAHLAGACFAGARFAGADFTRALLDEVSFEDAELPEVRLYEARGSRACFDRARMREARAEGATLLESSLRSIEAHGSEWEGATLDGSTLLGSSLAGAGFCQTRCRGTIFSGADVTEGRFRRAELAGAQFLRANLMRATFERADLTRADLRQANLHEAEVWRAALDGVDLDRAIVTRSKLHGRRR